MQDSKKRREIYKAVSQYKTPETEGDLELFSAVIASELEKILPPEELEGIKKVGRGESPAFYMQGMGLGSVKGTNPNADYYDGNSVALLYGLAHLMGRKHFPQRVTKIIQKEFEESPLHVDIFPFVILFGLQGNRTANTNVYFADSILGSLTSAEIDMLQGNNFSIGRFGNPETILIKKNGGEFEFSKNIDCLADVSAIPGGENYYTSPEKALESLKRFFRESSPDLSVSIGRGDVLLLGKGQMHERTEFMRRHERDEIYPDGTKSGSQRLLRYIACSEAPVQKFNPEEIEAARAQFLRPEPKRSR